MAPDHDNTPKAPDKGAEKPADGQQQDSKVSACGSINGGGVLLSLVCAIRFDRVTLHGGGDGSPYGPAAVPRSTETVGIDRPRRPRSSALHNDSCQTLQQHTSVSKLNDGELKALLDEAITYKNPKDREGKSALFKDLLLEAEENERNARAASAGGSELVRYCNPSAKRHGRNRRGEAAAGCSSISENVTHGGSLNNLAKEELYEAISHANRQRKTVSARQREGGSLPCDVNVGVAALDR